jgi:hypothetical protein
LKRSVKHDLRSAHPAPGAAISSVQDYVSSVQDYVSSVQDYVFSVQDYVLPAPNDVRAGTRGAGRFQRERLDGAFYYQQAQVVDFA